MAFRRASALQSIPSLVSCTTARSKQVSNADIESGFPEKSDQGADGLLSFGEVLGLAFSLGWSKPYGAPCSTLKGLHASNMRLRRFRSRLGELLMTAEFQQLMSMLILLDSIVVFGECIVDAIIDDRKDVPGTFLHLTYIVNNVLELLGAFLMPVFLLESIGRVFSLGDLFFQHPIYVLDFAMVSSTMLQEILRPALGRRLEHSFALLLRVWRVLRVAHGVYMVMFLRQTHLEGELRLLRQRLVMLEYEHGKTASVRGAIKEVRDRCHLCAP